MNRRDLFLTGAAATGGALLSQPTASAQSTEADSDWTFCLNMSTIRGQQLDAAEEIEVAAKAGYTAIEPWIRKLTEYVEKGGTIKDLKKRLDDHGLTVASAIGFAKYIVDDDAERAAGLEEAKRDMDMIAQLGGTHIAAPPAGATKEAGLDLFKAADRYRALIEVGETVGVIPMVEVWGFSKNLSRLGESAFVAIESGHPKACLLGDVYHIYKGGSDLAGLGMLSGRALPVFHMNDYPDMDREKINDADRVWTGDGVAPLKGLFDTFAAVGAKPVLSLELFNKTYWEMDALECAQVGLEKMRGAVAAATV